jgi:hypothetical protein
MTGERVMPYAVDFNDVSTVGLESSPVAPALAGLRAHEARYFKDKYDHVFTVEPASIATTTMDWVHRILEEERDIVISSRPLEATAFEVENIRIAYVFYESGLSINVMYTIDDPKKRAVGFKLSEGMEVPAELASRFKFARQKSKLAGTIRGSYFAFENGYRPRNLAVPPPRDSAIPGREGRLAPIRGVLALSLVPSEQARRTSRISGIEGATASDQGSVSTARHRASCALGDRPDIPEMPASAAHRPVRRPSPSRVGR